jgi:hypothetical protein
MHPIKIAAVIYFWGAVISLLVALLIRLLHWAIRPRKEGEPQAS